MKKQKKQYRKIKIGDQLPIISRTDLFKLCWEGIGNASSIQDKSADFGILQYYWYPSRFCDVLMMEIRVRQEQYFQGASGRAVGFVDDVTAMPAVQVREKSKKPPWDEYPI